MTYPSENYSNKLAIATALAGLGARAVTITAMSKVKPADSREKYKQVNKTASPPGRTPTDHQWFLEDIPRRQHGAFLLMMYSKYRNGHQPSPDAHGLAIVKTYRTYLEMTNNKPLVDLERLNLLVGHGFLIGWQEICKGAASKFLRDNLRVSVCRKCEVPHLTEAHYRTYTCSKCVN